VGRWRLPAPLFPCHSRDGVDNTTTTDVWGVNMSPLGTDQTTRFPETQAIDPDVADAIAKLKEANDTLAAHRSEGNQAYEKAACIETRATEALYLENHWWAGKNETTAKAVLDELRRSFALFTNADYRQSVEDRIKRVEDSLTQKS